MASGGRLTFDLQHCFIVSAFRIGTSGAYRPRNLIGGVSHAALTESIPSELLLWRLESRARPPPIEQARERLRNTSQCLIGINTAVECSTSRGVTGRINLWSGMIGEQARHGLLGSLLATEPTRLIRTHHVTSRENLRRPLCLLAAGKTRKVIKIVVLS